MAALLATAAVAALAAIAVAQPGGGGGGGGGAATSGETTSTSCPSYSTCSNTGSSNYAAPSLAFSTSTGKFSGTFVTNQCPGFSFTGQVRVFLCDLVPAARLTLSRGWAGCAHATARHGSSNFPTLSSPWLCVQNTPSCISQTFPAPAYASVPIAAPTVGRIGSVATAPATGSPRHQRRAFACSLLQWLAPALVSRAKARKRSTSTSGCPALTKTPRISSSPFRHVQPVPQVRH